MKNLKIFLMESSVKPWTGEEVYDFVMSIINGDHGDDEDADEYYEEREEELEDWYKKNKNHKFNCYTSTPDYWGFDKNEYEEVDELDEVDGPEDCCGIDIYSSGICGHSVSNGYMNMDTFDFEFSLAD